MHIKSIYYVEFDEPGNERCVVIQNPKQVIFGLDDSVLYFEFDGRKIYMSELLRLQMSIEDEDNESSINWIYNKKGKYTINNSKKLNTEEEVYNYLCMDFSFACDKNK